MIPDTWNARNDVLKCGYVVFCILGPPVPVYIKIISSLEQCAVVKLYGNSMLSEQLKGGVSMNPPNAVTYEFLVVT